MVAEARNEHVHVAEPFFGRTDFNVEERRTALKRQNDYSVWDADGASIAVLSQPVSVANHFWRVFLRASLLPFRFELRDTQGRALAAIRRGWTLLVSRTEVTDGQGAVIGYLKIKQHSSKPRIKVFNSEGKKIGEIAGTKGAWDMDIIDRDYHSFGAIRENDTDAAGKDSFRVHLHREGLTGVERKVMLVVAIAIDRLLIENG